MTNTWEVSRDVLGQKSNVNLTDSTVFSSYAFDVNATFQRVGMQQSGIAFDAVDGTSVVTESLDWSYDALGQVIAEDHSDDGRDNAYEFDSIGNRRRAVHGSLTLPPNPNYGANEVNQLTLTPFPTPPSYDDDGNMLTGSVLGSYDRPLGSLVAYTNAKWDGNNWLRQVDIDGEMVTFDYDYRGRRIEASGGKNASDTQIGSENFVYDEWNMVALRVGAHSGCTFTWGTDLSGSIQGAGGVGGLLVTNHIGVNCYPLYDGNGNACQYIGRADEVASGGLANEVAYAARWTYDAFGRTTWQSDDRWSGIIPHRLSTKERCWRSGLYYYGYRYYDPVTGRWLKRDPIQERGGLNLYGMVGNDVINALDYLGLDTIPSEWQAELSKALRKANQTAKMIEFRSRFGGDTIDAYHRNWQRATREATIRRLYNQAQPPTSPVTGLPTNPVRPGGAAAGGGASLANNMLEMAAQQDRAKATTVLVSSLDAARKWCLDQCPNLGCCYHRVLFEYPQEKHQGEPWHPALQGVPAIIKYEVVATPGVPCEEPIPAIGYDNRNTPFSGASMFDHTRTEEVFKADCITDGKIN